MLWRHRRDSGRLMLWLSVALPALLAAGLLAWQTRAGPAAQTLSIPGATALAWAAMMWLSERKSMLVRVVGIVAAVVLVSGIGTSFVTTTFPENVTNFRKSLRVANARCGSLAAMRPVAQQPPGLVLTFVDLGPRLITVTPHSAIAGPYHRNGAQILDVMRVWRGDEANARATIERYRVDYVLICPNLSESTIYAAEAPNGFYVHLKNGKVPAWLQPVALPRNSPFRMWRVVR